MIYKFIYIKFSEYIHDQRPEKFTDDQFKQTRASIKLKSTWMTSKGKCTCLFGSFSRCKYKVCKSRLKKKNFLQLHALWIQQDQAQKVLLLRTPRYEYDTNTQTFLRVRYAQTREAVACERLLAHDLSSIGLRITLYFYTYVPFDATRRVGERSRQGGTPP